MGMMKAKVGLAPLNFDDSEVWERVENIVNKDVPIVTPEAKITKMNKKLNKFILEKLEMYESTWKNERNFKHIDSPIPEGKL